MPKLSPEKWAELEGFWRHHHEGWKNSTLNQREYCELHGLPLKRFGNWRDRFKAEEGMRQAGLLYRRGGLSHMTDRENGPVSTGYLPSGRALPEVRRNFRLSDKKRIVAEAMAPGASVSGVARRYGIAPRVLFRWKQELTPAKFANFFPSIPDRQRLPKYHRNGDNIFVRTHCHAPSSVLNFDWRGMSNRALSDGKGQARGLCVRGVFRTGAVCLVLSAAAAAAWASETISYSYDARGRLVKVERSGTVNNGVAATYQYDKADNRKNVTVTGSANPPPP